MMDLISADRGITNPIRAPTAGKTAHIHHSTWKKLIAGWLVEAQCPYLDLFVPDTDAPAAGGKSPNNKLAYMDQEDAVGLIVEFITSEYQALLFAAKSAAATASSTTTTTSPPLQQTSSTSTSSPTIAVNATSADNQSSQPNTKWQTILDNVDINDKAQLDKLLTLHPTAVPSLSQYLHHLLHTSSLQLLDIEMYTASLDQALVKANQPPSQPQSKTNTKAQTQAQFSHFSSTALSSITPQNYTPQLLAQFNDKLTTVLNYYHAQMTRAKTAKTATPLTPILTNLSTKLLSSDKNYHLFGAIDKTIKTLTPAELKIVSQQLDGLYRDYKTRHRMILAKMLTQTQTFLLTLKLQYLQLQREDGKQAKAISAAANTKGGQKVVKAVPEPAAPAKKSNKPVKGAKGSSRKPIEDGADEQDDSDGGDDDDSIVGNNVTNIGALDVKNDAYTQAVKDILTKYLETAQLVTHLQPVSLPDLFTLAPYVALVLQHGNEKQLHRPRAKFQLQNHPKTKTLQVMKDRGGRL